LLSPARRRINADGCENRAAIVNLIQYRYSIGWRSDGSVKHRAIVSFDPRSGSIGARLGGSAEDIFGLGPRDVRCYIASDSRNG
jgi:hypothetical protein